MKRKALVVGLGIGQLYVQELKKLDYDVVTVDMDPSKNATYQLIDQALEHKYDVAHVCTPNTSHEQLAYRIAEQANIIFVEKPGLETEQRWHGLINAFPYKRITMIKNNQWRPQVQEWRDLLPTTRFVKLHWINYDRVPSPGSWFTRQALSWGGVSRDLMPHLLSIVAAVLPNEFDQKMPEYSMTQQRWRLRDLTATSYGTVNAQGVYDVDDIAQAEFKYRDIRVSVQADWRSLDEDDVSVKIYTPDLVSKFELGLCPDYVYGRMIADCVDNIDNDAFWYWQQRCDLWIHRVIDAISKSR